MEQNANYAASKDAQIKFSKEECASDTELRTRSSDAALKDAQIMVNKEDCA